ncbi:MAG: helix-turn-helix domain-containing protein [Lachnospiraceae bacterium]|nr:helix-turn-helix domain-containing protein [Lachnospiraceae bacterium]
MLSENIKTIRKSKGLSQEELAVRLNVVRQTVSKWEQGASVPDSELLIALSEALETPVSVLLGENVTEPEAEELKAISEKLEVINLQLFKRQQSRRKVIHGLFIALAVVTILMAVILLSLNSPYLEWNYNDPETAVLGTLFHYFEWVFVRIAPLVLIGAVVGIVATRRKDR